MNSFRSSFSRISAGIFIRLVYLIAGQLLNFLDFYLTLHCFS
jgi:hypothetical protein